MALVYLFQCQVGAFSYLSHATLPGENWTETEIAELQAVAHEVTPGNWEKLHQQVALTKKWHELTAAYDLPRLESQLAELESKLEEARRQRKRLGREARPAYQTDSQPAVSAGRGGFWNWFMPATKGDGPTVQAAEQEKSAEREKAQQSLKVIAREHARVRRQVETLTAQRWAQTFENARPQTLWFVLPLSASDIARKLTAGGFGREWPRVPELVLSCPVGTIPEDTYGHPGEREPRRWYFRSGLLAQQLLGPHEQPTDREALQELEEWITADPTLASELAQWLEGLIPIAVESLSSSDSTRTE